jgi:sugar diacid utilization regulator
MRGRATGGRYPRCCALPAQPMVLIAQGRSPISIIGADELYDLVRGISAHDGETSSHMLCGNCDEYAVAVTDCLRHADLDEAMRRRGWHGCAIGRYPAAHAACAYRIGANALRLAPPRAFNTRAVLRDGDAEVLALLSANRDASPAAVRKSVLAELDDGRHDHLLEGLAAFYGSAGAAEAAKQINVHPQTMRYRLKRVRELTGLDPRKPWDAFLVEVALAAPRTGQ